ncbi:hypothetical protein MSIBF_A3690003 [groundwater metagenome]|uniref:UDP-glucuronate decarboxylase n=1 Tax=groundwater metagenome TaxID=717931 RepID=A0A098EE73_9ZZZZ
MPEDGLKIRKPDISKARKYLNWEPKVKLEEGLERTIEYFKKKISHIIINLIPLNIYLIFNIMILL